MHSFPVDWITATLSVPNPPKIISRLQLIHSSARRLLTKMNNRQHISPVLAELHLLPHLKCPGPFLKVFHFKSQPALLNPAQLTCHISWVLTEKTWRCSPNSATAVLRILWKQTQLMFISSHIQECFHLLMIPLYSFNSWVFRFLICLFV